MKLLKYVLGGLAVTAAVGVGVVVYKWWKGRKQVRNHFAPAFEKNEKNAVTGKADSGCILWPRTMNIAVGTYRVRPSLCNVVND